MDMSPTLTMPTELEYRQQFHVERGGVPRPVYGAGKTTETINRETHDLVIEATDKVRNSERTDWENDLRRGRLRIYGGLLRFIDKLHRLGFSKEIAMRIPSWIAWYIESVWQDRPSEHVVEMDRAA